MPTIRPKDIKCLEQEKLNPAILGFLPEIERRFKELESGQDLEVSRSFYDAVQMFGSSALKETLFGEGR